MKKIFAGSIIVLGVLILSACFSKKPVEIIPVTATINGDYQVFLPTIINGGTTSTPAPNGLPTIHVPYKNVDDYVDQSIIEMAIFWFGEVGVQKNYTDVRIGYNDENLFVYAAIFDRLLWYDTSPSTAELTDWDSVSLFITPEDSDELVTNETIQFIGQLAPQEVNRNQYQAAFAWTGSSWLEQQNYNFTTTSYWRGEGLDTADDDRGWMIKFIIPFSSLGLENKPADQTIWKVGMVVHDRDYFEGNPSPDQKWPQFFGETNPQTWGKISFGALPSMLTQSDADGITLTIREGFDGKTVEDASIGGYTTCGEGLNFWTEWGEKTYTNPPENMVLNIQNQRDIADWPCYSKYFVKFPLDSIPSNAQINSAALVLHQFGNSGDWGDPVFQPYRSIIQVFSTNDSWNETNITWNNAPHVIENIASKQVDPLETQPPWPGVAHQWDLTYAIQKAINNGQESISLALYSADGAYHSGKYFSTSEVEDWNSEARPALTINYSLP